LRKVILVLRKPVLWVVVAVAAVVAAVVAVAVVLPGGGGKPHHPGMVRLPVGPPGTSAAGVLRLGFVTDVTGAPGMVGVQMGFFQRDLGRVQLEADPFTSMALEEAALAGGQLDAAFVDPVSVVAVSQQAHLGLVIVAGAAAGGAELVVRHGITRPGQLRGRVLVAPPGGVEQAAADAWLRSNGLPALTHDEAAASADAGVLHAFSSGAIAGGWEPAPLDAEMVAAGGHVLEPAGAPAGSSMPALVLAVTSTYLRSHAAAVAGLLEGEVQADQFLAGDRVPAEAAFQQRLAAAEGSALPAGVLASSFAQVTFTAALSVPAVLAEVREAAAAGLVRPLADPAGLFDLRELDEVLRH
jgi:NitT/TauT family transport system substrate-binding protein